MRLAEALRNGVAALAAVVVGDVLRVRRAHVELAMARAGVPDPARSAGAMYRSLGRGLVELLLVGLGRTPRVELPPEAAALRAAGRGAVVATAHTGAWDVVACGVASVHPLTVVTKHLRVGLVDALWQGIRRRVGVRLAGAGEAASAVRAALARGELVAMPVDQAPERARGAVLVPFLGAPAWVDLAPALCALRARAPLVAAFPLRLPTGEHTLHVASVFLPPERPSRSWAVDATVQVTRHLEEFVRAHPEQWLWMHRRWKGAAAREAGAERPSSRSGARRLGAPIAEGDRFPRSHLWKSG